MDAYLGSQSEMVSYQGGVKKFSRLLGFAGFCWLLQERRAVSGPAVSLPWHTSSFSRLWQISIQGLKLLMGKLNHFLLTKEIRTTATWQCWGSDTLDLYNVAWKMWYAVGFTDKHMWPNLFAREVVYWQKKNEGKVLIVQSKPSGCWTEYNGV